jgi:hypothetical protein
MILEGVCISLGRVPVRSGKTIGMTRTFATVLVNTLTESWIYSEGRFRGGKRYKVQVPPDFRCTGQKVKLAIPDPGGVAFRPHIIDGLVN